MKCLVTDIALCVFLVQNKIFALLWYQRDIYMWDFISEFQINTRTSPFFKVSFTILYVPFILHAAMCVCAYTHSFPPLHRYINMHIRISSSNDWIGSWTEAFICNTSAVRFWKSAFKCCNFYMKQKILLIIFIGREKWNCFCVCYTGLWSEQIVNIL